MVNLTHACVHALAGSKYTTVVFSVFCLLSKSVKASEVRGTGPAAVYSALGYCGKQIMSEYFIQEYLKGYNNCVMRVRNSLFNGWPGCISKVQIS